MFSAVSLKMTLQRSFTQLENDLKLVSECVLQAHFPLFFQKLSGATNFQPLQYSGKTNSFLATFICMYQGFVFSCQNVSTLTGF